MLAAEFLPLQCGYTLDYGIRVILYRYCDQGSLPL